MIELLAAIAVLSVLLLILLSAVASVSSLYVRSDQKVQAEERGRSILELFSREVTPAVVDSRMQFAILPGRELEKAGATNLASGSPAILWMSPLGKGGELRCVGYYLTKNPDLNRFRLKRIYIRHDNPDGYFPRMVNRVDARDLSMRTSAVNADWFTGSWDKDAFDDESSDNDKVVVSTVSDGVVGFWIRAIDAMGNPIPVLSESGNHPFSELIFNSSAFFYMSEGKPFDNGETFVYLSRGKLTMKANKIPAELEIALVMLSDDDIANTTGIPDMENIFDGKGALDLEGSVDALLAKLEGMGVTKSERFQTRVKLTNGG